MKAHPDDLAHREAAVVWYERRQPDLNKLEEHTIELAKHHPESLEIMFDNISAIYRDPVYGGSLAQTLEAQKAKGHREPGLYFNLGWVYELLAMPPLAHTSASKKRFYEYFMLPADTRLRTTVDEARASKAVANYQKAIELSKDNPADTVLVATDLVSLLSDLNRNADAAQVCERILPLADDTSKADLYLKYGAILYKLRRTPQAIRALSSVRPCDNEFGSGAGHATMRAETQLGVIAYDAGDLRSADRHLIASLNVNPCCHIMTQGVSISLAKKLLHAGHRDIVIQFCNQALSKFNHSDAPIQELLRVAKSR